VEFNTTNGIIRNEFYGNLKLLKVISLKGHFFTNCIIDLRMNSKYLNFEIMIPTPWKNTFDIGNLVDLKNIYFTIFSHVIMVLGNLFSYIQNSKWRFKVFKSWLVEGLPMIVGYFNKVVEKIIVNFKNDQK
jgi:hypothetical protein